MKGENTMPTYKVVEIISNICLPICYASTKQSAEFMAEQLRKMNKGRTIIVQETKKAPN